ncbi:hypothetical protein [Streptomyces sp. WELS2]|uniref:hypothetical protein n=1 Tax=Streptomyces sp. WELS2 TaxID=2749435 RepID=UPI0015F106AC|nr:hypothetical protein [Streptomyces sp. WELS2]
MSWVWVDTQGRSGVPGVLIAAVRQKQGGSRPYAVLLVGAGQCAIHQLLRAQALGQPPVLAVQAPVVQQTPPAPANA